MEQMTEYERKRLENVQRNRQMLAALRVHDTAERLRSATKKPKSETKAYKPPKREREPEPSVLRRSLRTRGLSPHRIGDLGSDGLPAAPREGLTPPSSGSPKPPTSSRKGPLRLAEAYAPYGEEDSYDHYFNRLRELRDHEPSADLICTKQDRESEGRGLVGPKFSPEDLNLEAKDIARVAPNRVLSVHILPCRERVIVVSGDREGYLSLWDADCEEEGKGFHMYQPHSAQLSGIATAPFSVEKVQFLPWSSLVAMMGLFVVWILRKKSLTCYTQTIRVFQLSVLRHMVFNPLILHGFQSAYFAEAHGEMKVLDLRVGGVSNSYDVHEKRINSIDFHPYNPHLVSTSSTDCTASIWDLRNMGKNHLKSIATVRHDRAVLSAHFSPSGNYLATSYNGNVGLLNGLDSWNTTLIYHSNPSRTRKSFLRTKWGRDCRAIWGWNDKYIFIGNLEKALDAICTSTKITTLHSPLMTAIPTRLSKHPFSHGILAGANGSGQVWVWRKH